MLTARRPRSTESLRWPTHPDGALEGRVAVEMQEALAAVQSGLERAEQVAVAAEESRAKAEQLVKVTLGLIGLSILLLVISRRRPG
jgi:hypothetical protein